MIADRTMYSSCVLPRRPVRGLLVHNTSLLLSVAQCYSDVHEVRCPPAVNDVRSGNTIVKVYWFIYSYEFTRRTGCMPPSLSLSDTIVLVTYLFTASKLNT